MTPCGAHRAIWPCIGRLRDSTKPYLDGDAAVLDPRLWPPIFSAAGVQADPRSVPGLPFDRDQRWLGLFEQFGFDL